MTNSKITGIFRNIDENKIIKTAEILIDNNINTFEVSYNSHDALKQIKLLKEHYPNAKIGAGTILNVDDLKVVSEAKPDFIFTPSVNEEVLEYSRVNNINLIPGVFSPSEVALCLNYGFNLLKLFPAENLSGSYVKNLKGPFNNAEFLAVGGVTASNILSFFQMGYSGVGMGSSLIKNKFLNNNDWKALDSHVKNILETIKEYL
jgi:2-dehydro-3-deoxyphosphogluconate aldolase/(4S)-4-hydroxy-2-oxoglutarate aldolase